MTTSAKTQIRRQRSFFPTSALAQSVECDESMLRVRLADGREIAVPLQWFPVLRDATPEQRLAVLIGGGGVSLHWPALNEDLSIAGLLAGGDSTSI